MNNRQHGFIQDKLCQTYLISFRDSVTDLVDKEVIYLEFCKLLPLSHITIGEGYTPEDFTAGGWKMLENHAPKLYLHGPLLGWNNVWSRALGPAISSSFINVLECGTENILHVICRWYQAKGEQQQSVKTAL